MKNSEKYTKAFNYFKQSYCYKMGGSQTVVLPNGKSYFFDDREYYSGRGSKFNSSINHDIKGEIKVSRKEYSAFLKRLKRQEELKTKRLEEIKKIENDRLNGVYSLIPDSRDGMYINLSQKERDGRFFDSKRLAKTLGVSVEDCDLLNSTGKTYVFATQKNGKKIEMYHPDLDCNELSIFTKEVDEDYISRFDSEKWQSAPFAYLVGQTSASNHFVC